MGNYCSSGHSKKDKDNISEKSDDSPNYQLANKSKKSDKHEIREAPLADPEPTSDISNQNVPLVIAGTNASNGNVKVDGDNSRPTARALQNIQSVNTNDSTSSSPLALNAPCDIPSILSSNQSLLPSTLTPIYGRPTLNRRTENDRKIVLYILAADDGHKNEKAALYQVYKQLREYSACHGFELHLVDAHKENDNFLDPRCWINQPVEARGGHHLAASCLSAITRHSNLEYIIPVLFLGTTLGSPLLPLTIESQDFLNALGCAAEGSEEKRLIEKWYKLDGKAQPPCYSLNTNDITIANDTELELQQLYKAVVETFSKELRDSYLTSVIEQEINNTVLISQELSKRCIWVHTGSLPNKTSDPSQTISSIDTEINRRLLNIQTDLKNQLSEKNLIRIPPSVQMPSDQLATTLNALITAIIDQIVDEHTNKYQIPYCTYGVDRNLLSEIEIVNQYSKAVSQNCTNIGIMDKVKQYVIGSSVEPLIIYGPAGSGKSVLSAKVAQSVHTWLPDCCFVIRYANLTSASSDIVSLFGSIVEQVSYFTRNELCTGPNTMEYYASEIVKCMEAAKHQVIILIDSLNEISQLNNIEWLPTKLLNNVKIITTITSQISNIDECSKQDWILSALKEKISKSNFVYLEQFSDQQWREVLSSGGGHFYAVNQLQLPNDWQNCPEKIPIQSKLFWWFAWLGETELNDISLSYVCEKVFQILEIKFGENIVRLLISLIVASRDGIRETDIIDLLGQSKLVTDSASKLWLQFCWTLSRGPLLLHTNHIKLMDNKLIATAKERYADDIRKAHETLYNYYINQPNVFSDEKGKYQYYNVNKLVELPFQAHALITSKGSAGVGPDIISSYETSPYLTDLTWIYIKIKATRSVQYILNDLNFLSPEQIGRHKHLTLLKSFLENNIRPINYDADQFYPLFKTFVFKSLSADEGLKNDVVFCNWIEHFENIPISYLENLANENQTQHGQDATTGYDAIVNLGGNGYFVASISTSREEICVWDVSKCQKVRTLKGIPQPASVCPIGDYGAAVLCRREIKVIDLNKGVFRVTLKGVMNQKMPYYGLHDEQHLVCLSRNRMYVNLMNLESGDCITTFKAGEDRFLNSLLVSGDGRILVCGDETQKPFPLLVWHLSQRKLLYDLRIPHHDFLTNLSAITTEGSYVCVVAKELNEPTPNFIVVYDLQSGTLFKKWKPSCNTVSLSISQSNACVIAGLEDARILIWDLVTGNCKFTLIGHTAPITLLKLDPTGSVLLSADKLGRDRSVRVWELSSGKAIAVHTPPSRISTCEILPTGKYITLALENQPNLVTLELKNRNSTATNQSDITGNNSETSYIYGDAECNEKVFHL